MFTISIDKEPWVLLPSILVPIDSMVLKWNINFLLLTTEVALTNCVPLTIRAVEHGGLASSIVPLTIRVVEHGGLASSIVPLTIRAAEHGGVASCIVPLTIRGAEHGGLASSITPRAGQIY